MKRQRGAERSKAYHLLTVWGFLLLTLVSGAFTLRAYIGNSAEAKQRFETLKAVDAAGGDVEKALFELRTFVYSHMNTTLGNDTGIKPVIQLSGTYARLVAAEKDRVKKANDDLYNKGQIECEKRYPDDFSGRVRVPCVSEYVIANAVKEQSIPEGLYKYEFVSPMWSPDAAGYGVLLTFVLFLVFMYRLIVYERIKHHIHMSA